MLNQTFYPAQGGCRYEQMEFRGQSFCCYGAAFHAEGQHSPKSIGHLAAGDFMPRVTLKAGVHNLFHLRMMFKVFCDPLRVL